MDKMSLPFTKAQVSTGIIRNHDYIIHNRQMLFKQMNQFKNNAITADDATKALTQLINV